MGLFLHLQQAKYLWLVFAMTRALDTKELDTKEDDDENGGDERKEKMDAPARAKGIKE